MGNALTSLANQRRAPHVLAVLLCAAYLMTLLHGIGDVPLLHSDEMRTAERSREILVRRDPLGVTENFEPVFAKPPLQYALTAPLIGLLGATETAVRLWPALFAALGLLATSMVAGQVWPNQRWAGLVSAAALACYQDYLGHGRSAMLDTGQAFFCMMALGTGLRARNSAVWWLASGGAAGFGCLQKSPLSAAFFLLAIVVVVLGDRATARKQLRFIAGGVALLVLLALLWPGIQGLRHGWTSFRTIYGTEIADRFLEHRAIISAPRSAYLSTYFGGWRMAGVAALGSLIAVFARARLRCNPAALGVAVAAAVYIALLPLAQPVYPRYLLALAPLLAVLMGGVTTGLPMTPRLRLILLGFVLFMSFPDISATVRVGSDKVKARRDLIEIVQLIKGSPQQGKRIRIVALEDDTTRSDYLSNAVLFYGEIPRGILKIEESSRRRIWPQAARGWTCYLIAPNSNSIRRGQGSAVWERVGKNASYTLWKMAF